MLHDKHNLASELQVKQFWLPISHNLHFKFVGSESSIYSTFKINYIYLLIFFFKCIKKKNLINFEDCKLLNTHSYLTSILAKETDNRILSKFKEKMLQYISSKKKSNHYIYYMFK